MELCTVALAGAPDIQVARAKASVAASLFGFSGAEQRRIAGAASALAHAVVDGGGGELRIERVRSTLGLIFRASRQVWGGANVARLVERPPVEPMLDDESLRLALADGIDGSFSTGRATGPLEEVVQKRREETRAWAQLAHDLKSPLTAIVGALDQLQEAELPQPHARFVQVAHSAARNLRDVVNATQQLALLEANQLALELQRVALADVVRGARLAVEPRLRAKEVKLEVALPPPDVLVDADLGRLSQTLAQLIDNAIKWSPRRGTVEVRYGARAGAHAVEVIDRGVGIEAARLPSLFELTARAPTAGTAGERGPGLGLPIARHLARLHGGTLAIVSSPAGTIATLTLPTA